MFGLGLVLVNNVCRLGRLLMIGLGKGLWCFGRSLMGLDMVLVMLGGRTELW